MSSRALVFAVISLIAGCGQLNAGIHMLSKYRQHTYRTSDDFSGPLDGNVILGHDSKGKGWSPQDRDSNRFSRQCSLAFAISGGGSIAASFSYGVLRELSSTGAHISPNSALHDSALMQVDYFSTASGGGITALLWLRLLHALHLESSTGDIKAQVMAKLDDTSYKKAMSFDYLQERTVARLIQLDMAGDVELGSGRVRLGWIQANLDQGIWCSWPQDGAGQCGDAAGQGKLLVADIFPEEGSELPVWVPNATAFADGRRVPLTPYALRALGVVKSRDAGGGIREMQATDFLAASMSFPGIGPYRFLVQNDRSLDLVDGGLSDNLGMFTALDLVASDLGRRIGRPGQTERRSERGLIVVIDSSADANLGLFTDSRRPSADDYVNELPYLQLRSQYPEAEVRLRALGESLGIHVLFIRARDPALLGKTVDLCPGLRPESRKEPGASGCKPTAITPVTSTVRDVLATQTTTLSLQYPAADAIMQLGRLAAAMQKNELARELLWCLDGATPDPAR
jgi:hypothetical protein